MAVIYLKHPVHGAKVAIMEAEAEYDEMHGWVRFDIAAPSEVDDGDVNELAPRRRGRRRADSQED